MAGILHASNKSLGRPSSALHSGRLMDQMGGTGDRGRGTGGGTQLTLHALHFATLGATAMTGTLRYVPLCDPGSGAGPERRGSNGSLGVKSCVADRCWRALRSCGVLSGSLTAVMAAVTGPSLFDHSTCSWLTASNSRRDPCHPVMTVVPGLLWPSLLSFALVR